MFLLRISSSGPRSLLKLSLSIIATTSYVLAITFAALGAFLIKAISPK
jgi:hypothetical protein